MLSKFRQVYTSREKIADESVIPFPEMLHFRQYIPEKSHEYGCKVYKICSMESI